MKHTIEYMINSYEKQIENINWHMAVNYSNLKEKDHERFKERINDFRNFINDLKALKETFI